MMNGALALDAAPEEAHGLLGVVDVVGAYREFPVGDLVEIGSGDYHREINLAGWGRKVEAER